jgi:DNA-binding winged helix-turn-helix (wHTH) protein
MPKTHSPVQELGTTLPARSSTPMDPMRYCPHCRRELSRRQAIDDGFDDANHTIVVASERRHVPRRAWQILEILRKRRGTIVSSSSFYQLIWESETGDPPFVEQVLRVHIFKLRRLLLGTLWRISTHSRLGYQLERCRSDASLQGRTPLTPIRVERSADAKRRGMN